MKDFIRVWRIAASTALIAWVVVWCLPLNSVEVANATCRSEFVEPGEMELIAADILALDRGVRLEMVRMFTPLQGRAMGLCVLDDGREYTLMGQPVTAEAVILYQPECFLESDFR